MSKRDTILRDLILQHVPVDGASIGNKVLLERLTEAADFMFTEADYQRVREALIAEGLLASGRERGGSVMRAQATSVEATKEVDGEDEDDGLTLEMQERPQPRPAKAGPAIKAPTGPRIGKDEPKQVISYRYGDKRKNNPHVGMVDTTSDGVEEPKYWRYDPHIDPALNFDSGRAQIENLIDDALASKDETRMRQALEQLKRMQSPYLNWTGKAERTSFEVDTVSLHVHERIDPATILAAVQKQLKNPSPSGRGAGVRAGGGAFQPDLFSAPFENLPLREAIDFYKHERDWSNRLIAGDSLLVMNSLLQKESMAGQVQMIYIDPPLSGVIS